MKWLNSACLLPSLLWPTLRVRSSTRSSALSHGSNSGGGGGGIKYPRKFYPPPPPPQSSGCYKANVKVEIREPHLPFDNWKNIGGGGGGGIKYILGNFIPPPQIVGVIKQMSKLK